MFFKIIVALLVFMVVVTFHEFGHFIFAKKSKIKVNEFSVGMGPKIFGKIKGETLYSVRVLPIGGYCAMEGEDESESESELKNENPKLQQSGNFNQASILGRILTIFGGPLFNFILAFVIMFGLFAFKGVQTTTVDSVLDNSIAQEYGILKGDKILKINNVDINSWKDIHSNISRLENLNFSVTVLRNSEQKQINVKLKNKDNKVLGITSKTKKNIFYAIYEGAKSVIAFIGMMFSIFSQLLTGKVGVGQLSGPIGVVSVISNAASNGIYSLLYITAFLSVNLGFINLLPIPALDGGRLVFLFIELIKGSPISRSKEGYIHTVGFILLMCLILFVSFKDILRLGIF